VLSSSVVPYVEGSLAEYEALAAKVDAFFARVHARYADRMRCGAGCDECCHAELSLAPVEAEALRRHVAALPAAERSRLAARAGKAAAAGEDGARCAALEDDGRCAVYAARPLVCRTHGVPMRVPRDARLPVMRDDGGLAVCHLNFEGTPLASLDADCVLNLESIDALLAVVNARACGERADRLARVALRDVLFSAHLP